MPGPWEGDLVFGRGMSPVATPVERSTSYLMVVGLPGGHRAELVADVLAAAITTLPRQPTRSLTWDQGHEMADHARFIVDTGIDVCFRYPKSPWQRGSNENTNGLLRSTCPAPSPCTTTARTTSTTSPPNSTDDLHRPSASRHHPKH